MTALGAALGALSGVAICLIFTASRRSRRGPSAPGGPGRLSRLTTPRDYAVGALAGTIALVATRWPVAFPLAAAATVGLATTRRRAAKNTVSRLEAVGSWTEMLRDTLAASAGVNQSLISTAAVAPAALRAEIQSLASKLAAGMEASVALAEFADDVGDPAADVVAAALTMAMRERGQRLAELLGALAQATREEVAMRLEIEASRASARAAVKMISGFSLSLFAALALFARSYLSPYGSATGQLVLVLVAVLFGFGLWLMTAMIRPRELPRLLVAARASS